MNLCRCPVCHSNINLDGLIEDEAGRKLLALLTRDVSHGCASPLVEYIALFRPAKSNLSNSRALKLAKEVIALYVPSRRLAHALSETATRIKEKRNQGQHQALSNHKYLGSVYDSISHLYTTSGRATETQEVPKDKAQDDYFEQMQRFGQDVSKLPGGAEWLATKGD